MVYSFNNRLFIINLIENEEMEIKDKPNYKYNIGDTAYVHLCGDNPTVEKVTILKRYISRKTGEPTYRTDIFDGFNEGYLSDTELQAYERLRESVRHGLEWHARKLVAVKEKIKELKEQEEQEEYEIRNSKELHLILKHKWYDMIASGEKKVEYRDLKDYYRKKFYNKNYTHVVFHKGYTNETMTFRIEGIGIGEGKPEWGAEPDKNYFKIVLGKRYGKN